MDNNAGRSTLGEFRRLGMIFFMAEFHVLRESPLLRIDGAGMLQCFDKSGIGLPHTGRPPNRTNQFKISASAAYTL
jgi:hypothetical protein